MRKYWILRMELEEGNSEVLPELLRIRDYFLETNLPKNFDPFDPSNAVIKHEKEFEAMCSSMEEAGITQVKQMTVFEFYSRVEHFEKQNKPKN